MLNKSQEQIEREKEEKEKQKFYNELYKDTTCPSFREAWKLIPQYTKTKDEEIADKLEQIGYKCGKCNDCAMASNIFYVIGNESKARELENVFNEKVNTDEDISERLAGMVNLGVIRDETETIETSKDRFF
jgi:hypothetical protein